MNEEFCVGSYKRWYNSTAQLSVVPLATEFWPVWPGLQPWQRSGWACRQGGKAPARYVKSGRHAAWLRAKANPKTSRPGSSALQLLSVKAGASADTMRKAALVRRDMQGGGRRSCGELRRWLVRPVLARKFHRIPAAALRKAVFASLDLFLEADSVYSHSPPPKDCVRLATTALRFASLRNPVKFAG